MYNRLRQIRRLRGMTIIDLHRASGVSCGHISDIETGKKVPGVDIALRLADALGSTVGELFLQASDDQAATSDRTA